MARPDDETPGDDESGQEPVNAGAEYSARALRMTKG